MADYGALLCDIIANELQIDGKRVVQYAGNWNAPNDIYLYIVVSMRPAKILSSKNMFDSETGEEVKTVVSYQNFDIDITSKNEDAIDKKEEVVMSIKSQFSLNLQEKYGFKIFRTGDIQDLSFIEGASALKRFRIPVRVSMIHEKRTLVDIYDKFRDTAIAVERG